jgi:hypothetical protein
MVCNSQTLQQKQSTAISIISESTITAMMIMMMMIIIITSHARLQQQQQQQRLHSRPDGLKYMKNVRGKLYFLPFLHFNPVESVGNNSVCN